MKTRWFGTGDGSFHVTANPNQEYIYSQDVIAVGTPSGTQDPEFKYGFGLADGADGFGERPAWYNRDVDYGLESEDMTYWNGQYGSGTLEAPTDRRDHYSENGNALTSAHTSSLGDGVYAFQIVRGAQLDP